MKKTAVFRRQRVITHNPDVMLCTIDHDSDNNLLCFGVSRKSPRDKTDKKFGRKVAERRARKANRVGTKIYKDGSVPFFGVVDKLDLKQLLIQFHSGNFRRD